MYTSALTPTNRLMNVRALYITKYIVEEDLKKIYFRKQHAGK
tara:strand:+ start:634 stop:759 length:126 start_codon:yes stop_codon:yes gene_type:complete